ncbi:uncharacterized protein [Blastocystis hominis]|uniref:Tyrosine specific protein phosphatases domain-containing protein n=1 Tax=Blastocystis hominis TaxID=12968 RepID=D8M9A5_BLAHO|nr:uncharacterized protein [Blastocystis hominis]CBK24644.2 unnamed protein product [Blastocystis hominis]|eukprot:XP_012898692.1 uncharacterized protein [Blastocystis hominis]
MLSRTTIWNGNNVIPPKLFDCVSPGVYRSNRFSKENFSFIEAIGLKYIVYVGNNDVGDEIEKFAESHSITLISLFDVHPVLPDDWKPISDDTVKRALEIVKNPKNFPVLLMCKDGIGKTGTVVGCLRRLQNWCFTSIIQEYRRLASSSSNVTAAELYIELFTPELVN